MIRQGKIGFRTCFQGVLIPTSYIIQLARASYSGAKEPHCFQDAFDNWLLLEVLNAIGQHTVI